MSEAKVRRTKHQDRPATHGAAGTGGVVLDAWVRRALDAERRHDELLEKYHDVVKQIVELKTLGTRVATGPVREPRVMGGPSDEAIVKEKEAAAAQDIVKRLAARKNQADEMFILRAVKDLRSRGMPEHEAKAEAERLLREVRAYGKESTEV